MMTFRTIVSEFEDKALYAFFLPVPEEVSEALIREQPDKRVVCTIEGLPPFHCALQPRRNAGYFIHCHKERRKALGLEPGTEVTVRLEPDTSKYGMPMPEEFAELLNQDPAADRYFHDLTPGRQRTLLYMIAKPKRSDTRLRKAVAIAEYLKSSGGQIDYRELNQWFKDFRF